ncbi:MAG: hypothetical protein M3Q23_07610 [Actinomycetota bacterium]|nr:hypothetical protein [Actinomycetota bacterium]
MSDLRTLLERATSGVEPGPDAWDGIRARERRRRRNGRLVAGTVAVVVAAGGLAAAIVSLHPSSPPAATAPTTAPPSPESPPPSATPVSVTVHAQGFPATCTATLASSQVRPGDSVSIAYSVQNGSDRTLYAGRFDPFDATFGRLRVEDRSGSVLFDTQTRHFGQEGPGPTPPQPLQAGDSMELSSESVVVRWAGPLRLLGSCPAVEQSTSGSDPLMWPAFAPFDLTVIPEGPAPEAHAAMARAVAATGGLLNSCRPGPNGEPTDGILYAPAIGSGAPLRFQPVPLETTCWADVRPGPGFVDITLFFSSPRGTPPPAPSGPTGIPSLGPGRPAEVGRWEVVVTPSSAVTAEFPRSIGRSPDGGDIDYAFTDGRWEIDGTGCGAGSFFAGPVVFFPPPGEHACDALP